jgi:hypothetical protein
MGERRVCCCICGFAPLDLRLYAKCVDCDHPLCSGCAESETRLRDCLVSPAPDLSHDTSPLGTNFAQSFPTPQSNPNPSTRDDAWILGAPAGPQQASDAPCINFAEAPPEGTNVLDVCRISRGSSIARAAVSVEPVLFERRRGRRAPATRPSAGQLTSSDAFAFHVHNNQFALGPPTATISAPENLLPLERSSSISELAPEIRATPIAKRRGSTVQTQDKRSRHKSYGTSDQCFVCPFYRYAPDLHRKCASKEFPDLSRLKQVF